MNIFSIQIDPQNLMHLFQIAENRCDFDIVNYTTLVVGVCSSKRFIVLFETLLADYFRRASFISIEQNEQKFRK